MAIVFHPAVPVDDKYWVPALRDIFKDQDFRVWPDIGNGDDVRYLIGWDMRAEDKDAFPNLEAFLTLRAGVERNIASPHMRDDLKLIRMIDPGLIDSMVEYVTSFVMRFHREHDAMAEHMAPPWWRFIPARACDRTVGFMGLGQLGQACAAPLVSMNFKVKGWSLSPKAIPGVDSYAGPEAFEAFLSDIDILVCLLPLTEQTENILDADLFAALPKGACVINAARGRHLVDEDLLSAVHKEQISYAALDVFRQEPLDAEHPFMKEPRIFLTPHIAATTIPETGVKILKKSIEQLERGEIPAGLVDRHRGY